VATSVLPTRTDGAQRYSFRCPLGASIYAFEFFWNSRDASWSFTLSDTTGNLLLSRKITVGAPLLNRFAGSTLPYGELIAYDTSGANQDPGVTELGTRVLLMFTDGADILAL
jgi:hypothetical protein